MNIVIIGTGNVGTALGKKLSKAGHRIVQVYGRNASRASELAYEWDTESTNYKSLILSTADLYIIALSDGAIEEWVEDWQMPGKLVVHTAASVSKEVLKNTSENFGVFYPLQSLRKESVSDPEIPIFYDGSNEYTINQLEKLAKSIAGEHTQLAGDADRIKLHIAAVMASNFTNHLYRLVQDYCQKENIDFAELQPLIEETATRLRYGGEAKNLQTGPAVRNDKETLAKHTQLLAPYPELQRVYAFFSESIQQVNR